MTEDNLVERHEEYCPCEECCYEESLQVSINEAELLQANRDAFIGFMQNPDLPY